MASFTIRKGLDIKLEGPPASTIADAPAARRVFVFPSDHPGIKPRLLVKDGDMVRRGSPLLQDKKNEAFFVTSPAAGRVASVAFGPRRVVESICIELQGQDEAVSFHRSQPADVLRLDRADLLASLQRSGVLALIQQRPFGGMASAAAAPKSIFVNGMCTGPFTPDLNVLVKGRELAFQAGLDALTRLTAGKVHLCLDKRAENAPALTGARNVEVHTFEGPHPSGNTSVHISRIDPMKPADVVWTIHGAAVLELGHFVLNGEVPATRVVSLAGPGVAAGARQYYRVRPGQPLQDLLNGRLAAGEQRVIRGDILSGEKVASDSALRLGDFGLTVLTEDRERHLLGWAMPGFSFFSASFAFASTWLGGLKRTWALGTNQHGELRPMVLTGLYDKYLPLDIMTDYLVRAVLANDTDEAIKLGILEVLPEDFALCAFACPSKMDLVGIIRKGLQDIEKEGI